MNVQPLHFKVTIWSGAGLLDHFACNDLGESRAEKCGLTCMCEDGRILMGPCYFAEKSRLKFRKYSLDSKI